MHQADLVLATLVLFVAALPAGGSLARLAVGVVATTLTLALVDWVARRSSTRLPRGRPVRPAAADGPKR